MSVEFDIGRDKALPPPRLRYKVTGGEDADWFIKSGKMSLQDLSRALAAIGRSFEEFNDVLDWGCGCGRMLRHLTPPLASKRLCGCDIDEEAISWVVEHLPWVEASCTGGLPPLPYCDASFDLIFNHSVMTHLNASHQHAWLGELKRILRPGGITILTVHGPHAFQKYLDALAPDAPDRATRATELHARGIVFITSDEWSSHFPDFYHTSFNEVSYIFDHWARFFDIRCYIPQGALNYQDLVVLERPADDRDLSRTYHEYVGLDRPVDGSNSVALEDVLSRLPSRHKLRIGWRLLREGLGLRRKRG